MKYKLRRQTKNNILGYGCFAVLTVILGIAFEMVYFYIMALICAGLLIYEMSRSKEETLIFDDYGFSIGGKRYNYSDIERIDSTRFKGLTTIKIIVESETVYKFDSSYENTEEFFRVLTLNGVEHDLLGR